ncbi:hypothetical protein [Kitasatospora sp. GP82]|uniref:hypothetical protein n=1 Tax=Kitasatospora sp. GP82 TaxID=3035089 RepID=UPI002475392B|nr:hypothetical protein [Kitasatospora sp. GP82]MDH6125888.1 hypothetical protein [Kitasatospora sp. GP82]
MSGLDLLTIRPALSDGGLARLGALGDRDAQCEGTCVVVGLDSVGVDIQAARDAGASRADLAHPLGVTSRQAAERRYLCLRPAEATDSATDSTGDQRVKAERDRRAPERAVTAWARHISADLRRLAGQIGALDDLTTGARPHIDSLLRALGDNDAARLIGPLVDTRPHLEDSHPDLAARVDALTRHTAELRRHSNDQRRTDPRPGR